MYSNFEFYAPTKIVFGKGAEENAGRMVKAFGGTRVLIHYGSQSALRSGLIGRVQQSGIQAMERFYHQIGMPVNMRELGIEPTEEQIAFMAASCEDKAGGANGQVIPLKKEDMEEIYRMAL